MCDIKCFCTDLIAQRSAVPRHSAQIQGHSTRKARALQRARRQTKVLPPGSSGRLPRGPGRRDGTAASAATQPGAQHEMLCQQRRRSRGAVLQTGRTIGNDFDLPVVEAIAIDVEGPHEHIAGDCRTGRAAYVSSGSLQKGWCGGGATPSEGTLPGGGHPTGSGNVACCSGKAVAVGGGAARAEPAWARGPGRTPPLKEMQRKYAMQKDPFGI